MRLDWAVVGEWLLVVCLAAVVVEGVVAALWTLRLSRRARVVRERLEVDRGRLESDVATLRLALAETAVLWQPYGRLLRWLRHPLAIALIQSFVRRRAAR